MPTVLITGAAGFIGGHLADYLRKKGCGTKLCIRQQDKINKLIPGQDYVAVDLDDPHIDYAALFSNIDMIIHLAGKAHSVNFTREEIYRSNYASTARLFDAAVAAGLRRFIYLSTAKVYKKNASFGGDNYSGSKSEAEKYIEAASAERNIETVILRSPLVYGPGVRANFLRLMQLVRSGVPLPFANIANQRSFVYVENLCDLIYTCICQHRMKDQKILCVKDWDVSTPELIRMLARNLGVKARLFPCPRWLLNAGFRLLGQKENLARLTDSLVVDDSYTRTLLKWAPPVPPEAGIQNTAMWFKEKMND